MIIRINDVCATSPWEQPRLDILGNVKQYRNAIPLHIDWLNFHGALYACRNWHYTGSMPSGKTIKVGIWEHGKFIGCVVYSRGANPSIGKPFQLAQTQVCELTRIALRQHQIPVSKLISVSLRFLQKLSPGLKLIISYADEEQGHVGTVYQASNWLYLGKVDSYKVRFGNEMLHPRTMNERARRAKLTLPKFVKATRLKYQAIRGLTRHKYVWPLDDETTKQIERNN